MIAVRHGFLASYSIAASSIAFSVSATTILQAQYPSGPNIAIYTTTSNPDVGIQSKNPTVMVGNESDATGLGSLLYE